MIRNRQGKQKNSVADSPESAPVEFGLLIAVLASLTAAWIIAGSTGLLAHPLRRALSIIALAVVVLARGTLAYRNYRNFLGILITAMFSMYLISSPIMVVNILGVSLVPAYLAFISTARERKLFCIFSVSIAVFGLYRLAYTSVPMVWLIFDSIGRAVGNFAGLITGQALNVGATFAGLDFLVLMLILWILWASFYSERIFSKAVYGFLVTFIGHLIYLIALSYLPKLLTLVPEPAAGLEVWSWTGLYHKIVPWNLPARACGIQLVIAAFMIRWYSPVAGYNKNHSKTSTYLNRNQKALLIVMVVLAIIVPLVSVFFPKQLTLEGKKVVFFEKGFLNWLKPEHGQYGRLSSGMYGMLPVYLESMGANAVISEDLSEQDIHDADAVVLLFPDDPWEQGQLSRIWNYVNTGGTLLVMGEHTTVDSDGSNRFKEVLEPTEIEVEFDSATFTVGGWLQSYDVIAHPATIGVPDERNQFGVVIGASLLLKWPARPLLIGRYGWSDIGDQGSSSAMMGDGIINSGEKIGDLILVAEQPLGKGRVIAFGDTSSLTNGINVSSYVFTSRLFGYLAGDSKTAHPLWRQLLAIITILLLSVLLIWNPNHWKVISIVMILTFSLTIFIGASQRAGEIFQDGRYQTPNNLAYVDSSHLGTYSGESWRNDGIGGLMLTLMRNGYLTHSLSEFSAERLKRADLFITIAPSKSFSNKEQEAIKDFVLNGGDLIIMAGYDSPKPGHSLMSLFGFSIGSSSPDAFEPEPMGHFKSPYLSSGDQQVFVRLYAAWPVICNDSDARIIAYGQNSQPVIILRKFGEGKVVVIGDACFAENRNLEWESGETFEGMRENADFWRWFITQLRDEEMWIPTALESQPEAEENQTQPAESNQEVEN
ncbi:hypothetical protein ACFLZ8_02135 [Planctomycetota bacterium]